MQQDNGQFGTYRILNKIGDGAFGVVYRAYHPFLDRDVAIKTLKTAQVTDSQQEQQFMREARTIARLRHNNIVTIYEFANTQINGSPTTYLVMEYLSNNSLEARLATQRRLSAIETIVILEQLASALDYAHARGVVHRDLKPANILFNESGQPVIVDFGLAKLIEAVGTLEYTFSSAFDSTLMGTPAYMSPEQISNKPITAASDQYALAVLAYYMLSGRHPFNLNLPIYQMLRQRLEQPPALLHEAAPDYDETVSFVLARALSLNPADRYPTCGDFVRELGRALLPDRYVLDVVKIIDPVQLAMLQAARQTLARGLRIMAGLALLGMFLLLGLVVNGYTTGGQAIYVWDGIYSERRLQPDGSRIVMGTYPGSAAERAGIRPGDRIYGDLLLDTASRSGRYEINGLPRVLFSSAWQPGPDDVIRRQVADDGGRVHYVVMKLERSPYLLYVMAVMFTGSVFMILVALWLLQRWGAEPGLQVFFVLILVVAVSLYVSPLIHLAPYIEATLIFAALAVICLFLMIFPAQLRLAQHYPIVMRLVFLPILIPLLMFVTAQPCTDEWFVFVALVSGLYTLLIVALVYTKIRDKQHRLYPGIRWFVIVGLESILFGIPAYALGILDMAALQALGLTAFGRDVLLHGLRVTILTQLIAIGAYGYHRIQWALGTSLPLATSSDVLHYNSVMESSTVLASEEYLGQPVLSPQ